jgi:hypothetical protein
VTASGGRHSPFVSPPPPVGLGWDVQTKQQIDQALETHLITAQCQGPLERLHSSLGGQPMQQCPAPTQVTWAIKSLRLFTTWTDEPPKYGVHAAKTTPGDPRHPRTYYQPAGSTLKSPHFRPHVRLCFRSASPSHIAVSSCDSCTLPGLD